MELKQLRNIGRAMLRDFDQLGIATVAQLAAQDADDLYLRLCVLTQARQDPCVHDTFAAAIHQAKTREALDWWKMTPARKVRQSRGDFPSFQQ